MLLLTLPLYSIDPHGSRLDRGQGSSTGGAIFSVIILIGVGIFYLIMKYNDSSSNSKTLNHHISETEDWDKRLKELEKRDKDIETGLKWGCGLPLIWVIIYIMNYFLHFI